LIQANPLKITANDTRFTLLRVFRGFISKLSANYCLLITQYVYRLPNIYFNTDLSTGTPWGQPGLSSYRVAMVS